MEAWRRALDEPVSAFPVAEGRSGAHRDAEDVRSAAFGAGRPAACRRAATRKRLLFPTEDGELVLLVHLMTAGRLRYLRAGERGRRRRPSGSRSRAALSSCSPRRARRSAPASGCSPRSAAEAELAHLGPEALGLGAESLEAILASESRRLHSLLRDQRVIAGIGRAWANEILHHARLSPFALCQDLDRGAGRAACTGDRHRARARARAARARRERRAHLPRPRQARASRATSAARRSRASTTRSTRSTTAPTARPAAAC